MKNLTQSPEGMKLDLNSHLKVFVAKVCLGLLLHAVLFITGTTNFGLRHIHRMIVRAWHCRLLQIIQTEGRTQKILRSDKIMKSV